jgi:hypothetical protein
MNKNMILATIAILAAGITLATTGPTVITTVVAQATDNATMAGNMTAGNMTGGGNSTDATGSISTVDDSPAQGVFD